MEAVFPPLLCMFMSSITFPLAKFREVEAKLELLTASLSLTGLLDITLLILVDLNLTFLLIPKLAKLDSHDDLLSLLRLVFHCLLLLLGSDLLLDGRRLGSLRGLWLCDSSSDLCSVGSALVCEAAATTLRIASTVVGHRG